MARPRPPTGHAGGNAPALPRAPLMPDSESGSPGSLSAPRAWIRIQRRLGSYPAAQLPSQLAPSGADESMGVHDERHDLRAAMRATEASLINSFVTINFAVADPLAAHLGAMISSRETELAYRARGGSGLKLVSGSVPIRVLDERLAARPTKRSPSATSTTAA
jgi:hypothetical protein